VSFAKNGTVALAPGTDLTRGVLAWTDRAGQGDLLDMEVAVYGAFDIAPDGRRFALQIVDVRDYVKTWDEDGGARDLPLAGKTGWPVWSPDGATVALQTRASGVAPFEITLYEFRSGTARALLSSEREVRPESWVESGHISLWRYGELVEMSVVDVASPADLQWKEGGLASLSRDAAWIAYTSPEGTGRYQVWLDDTAGTTHQQVSTDGGLEPHWCRSCDELFFRWGNVVFASRITLTPRPRIERPRPAFEAPGFIDTWGRSYRVSSDGERLYYVRRAEAPVRDRIHVIHNWLEELARPTPGSG
jgi:hypothetical protein